MKCQILTGSEGRKCGSTHIENLSDEWGWGCGYQSQWRYVYELVGQGWLWLFMAWRESLGSDEVALKPKTGVRSSYQRVFLRLD